MKSIWSMYTEIEKREALIGELKTDAAVIWTGMAGILIAYHLQEGGVQVVVLEADRIAGGETKNTTAKITSQHKKKPADNICRFFKPIHPHCCFSVSHCFLFFTENLFCESLRSKSLPKVLPSLIRYK